MTHFGRILALLGMFATLTGCGAAVDRFLPLAEPATGGSSTPDLVLAPVENRTPDPSRIGEHFRLDGRQVGIRTGRDHAAQALFAALARECGKRGLAWGRGAPGVPRLAAWIEELHLRKTSKMVYTTYQVVLRAGARLEGVDGGERVFRTTVEQEKSRAGGGDDRAVIAEAMATAAAELLQPVADILR